MVGAMTLNSPETSLRARLISIVAEITEMDPANVHGNLRLREDLGMDSLGSLELLSTISERMNLDLEMEDAMHLVTVEDAAAFVEQRCAERDARGRVA